MLLILNYGFSVAGALLCLWALITPRINNTHIPTFVAISVTGIAWAISVFTATALGESQRPEGLFIKGLFLLGLIFAYYSLCQLSRRPFIVRTINVSQIVLAYAKAGYPLYDDGRLNLFGVRSTNKIANQFDDTIGAIRKVGDGWRIVTYAGTTDPGTFYLKNPLSVKGAAVMVAGYYPKLWQRGLHRGVREAFVQVNNVRVYRDGNKDNTINCDPNSIQCGMFGINLHDAYGVNLAQEVGKWSAGCQVIQHSSQLDYLTKLADELIKTGKQPKQFDYALFLDSQV